MAAFEGPDAARSALRKARQEQAERTSGMPSLHLLIWPTPSALRLSLVIYHSKPGMRRSCTVLKTAEWQPKEVSERALVDWGQRALASWLENPTIEHTTMQAWPK